MRLRSLKNSITILGINTANNGNVKSMILLSVEIDTNETDDNPNDNSLTYRGIAETSSLTKTRHVASDEKS